MSTFVGVVVALVVVSVASWLLLVSVLWRHRPDGATARDVARLLPDVARLTKRLAADRELPRSIRVRLWLLLAYLLLPIDLVPDVIPVIGYADDVIIATLVLRSVLRTAGADAIERHWTGTDPGLEIVLGVLSPDATSDPRRGR